MTEIYQVFTRWSLLFFIGISKEILNSFSDIGICKNVFFGLLPFCW